ncbi:hypothetical protein CLM85_31635, partial [Streptomyces albidoflavus]|uniref:hypothetical protein n=1 Tax=Streptomyces albidoflavus TaxID=1886 RepID=UPI000BCBF51F
TAWLDDGLAAGPEFPAVDGQAEGAQAPGAEDVAAGLGRGVGAARGERTDDESGAAYTQQSR